MLTCHSVLRMRHGMVGEVGSAYSGGNFRENGLFA
jgi:hypothetical protein